MVVNYASDKEGAERRLPTIVKSGGKAIAVQGDVAKSADVQRLFVEDEKAFGKLDVLVNNAGVFKFAPIGEVTEAEFQRQFGTNVWGVLSPRARPCPI